MCLLIGYKFFTHLSWSCRSKIMNFAPCFMILVSLLYSTGPLFLLEYNSAPNLDFMRSSYMFFTNFDLFSISLKYTGMLLFELSWILFCKLSSSLSWLLITGFMESFIQFQFLGGKGSDAVWYFYTKQKFFVNILWHGGERRHL